MNKVVFIDRDGTINIDNHGYINKVEDFELFPFSAKAIRKLNELGFKVVVITNQSGVARGYYTLEDVETVHHEMIRLLTLENAVIDDILISPYHPQGVVEPFNIAHEDRKPGTGLLKKYTATNPFKTSQSFVIGDKFSDIGLGNNFHIPSILVLTGEGTKSFNQRNDHKAKPDFVVKDLWEAVKLIEIINRKKEIK